MVDPISPAPSPRPSPRAEPPPAQRPAPPANFSPVEAAALLRLAESEFVRNLARAALQRQTKSAGASAAGDFLGQDLTDLGGDTRGGQVNLRI